MDKINSIGIQQSQTQMIQEMQRMAGAAGSSAIAANTLTSMASTQVAFSQVMAQAINSVDSLQHSASNKQMAVDMGLSDDLMGTMVESQKATIAFSAMVEVRNKLSNALDQVINISM